MKITYNIYNNTPPENMTNDVVNLYNKIFDVTSDDLMNKVQQKSNVMFHLAIADDKVIGFKIGYELNEKKFYSWLGGVDPNYRKHGIASKLIEQQHQYLREHGYEVVQTKTMNRWRGMLLLNIKSGFDVIETYTDNKGLHKIVLEKTL